MTEKILLLLAGAAIALGATLAQHLVSEAHADPGAWQCYVVDRFPDMQAAAGWKGAVKYTEALNLVAAGAPTGTILTTEYPASGQTQTGNPPILCVKQ